MFSNSLKFLKNISILRNRLIQTLYVSAKCIGVFIGYYPVGTIQ